MWDTIKELFKLPGNKIIAILAATLTFIAFLEIGYYEKNWHLAVRNAPNWYLLATGLLLSIFFLISYRFDTVIDTAEKANGSNSIADGNGSWLSKFSSIGVDPLIMYGFEDKPSTTAICDVCCVHVMWADPRGNSVKVELDDGDCFIHFSNIYPGSYPSDVTIRPSGHQPLSNRNPDGTLCHSTLVVRVQNASQSATDSISVGFRVVDRLGTHWSYAKGPDFHIVTNLAPGEAKDAICSLDVSKNWQLFSTDGNRKYKADDPDFSIISAIVIEVGGPNGNRRPGTGKGSVILKGIYLKDE